VGAGEDGRAARAVHLYRQHCRPMRCAAGCRCPDSLPLAMTVRPNVLSAVLGAALIGCMHRLACVPPACIIIQSRRQRRGACAAGVTERLVQDQGTKFDLVSALSGRSRHTLPCDRSRRLAANQTNSSDTALGHSTWVADVKTCAQREHRPVGLLRPHVSVRYRQQNTGLRHLLTSAHNKDKHDVVSQSLHHHMCHDDSETGRGADRHLTISGRSSERALLINQNRGA